MDIEFGGGRRAGHTPVERLVNRLHHEHEEEMCREFGSGGTTREQRKTKWLPMNEETVPLG